MLQNANAITSAQMARDYRNLIDPGRRARRAERPTRVRAYAAIGGMYGVMDSFAEKLTAFVGPRTARHT
jgi:hypothetical protein